MGCEFPIKAYRSEELTRTGKRSITFNPLRSVNSTSPFLVPCGKCMGCRLDRSYQWAVRMMHEAKQHQANCFLTLTYDQQHVPANYGLDLAELQRFMKRFRKSVPQKIRFYACGEYGDENLRPHYHAIIFGHDFADRKVWAKNERGDLIYVSDELAKVWPIGLATTQDVTFQSAAYVSRYVTKKITGPKADDHYRRWSPIDGNEYQVRPEFAVMSRRPGIGTSWFNEFRSDIYPSGYLVIDGRKAPVPRFYKLKLAEEEQTHLKRAARRASLAHKADQTTERRWARVAVRDARISNLKRKL